MACMKCGKDTEEGRTFCAHCLEVMETYPVKPDVHIQLPVRSGGDAPKKQSRKRPPTRQDVNVTRLHWQIRLLWVVVIALLLAIGFLLLRTPLGIRAL